MNSPVMGVGGNRSGDGVRKKSITTIAQRGAFEAFRGVNEYDAMHL